MTAIHWNCERARVAWVGCAALLAVPAAAHARWLDSSQEMKFGLRAYVNARIGTEETDRSVSRTEESLTFPHSAAGHLRQNRVFVEAEFDHRLSRLTQEGLGPLVLLDHLPFRIRGLKYHLVFRGEADGLYDWGPREYSTAAQYIVPQPGVPTEQVTLRDNPISGPRNPDGSCAFAPANSKCARRVDVPTARRRLRKLGTERARLFQAYVEGSVGNLFLRLGRQLWSWGESDAFALLDHINPIDSSFGGFLISLDERRVPLDMLRVEYRVGKAGPLSEIALHAYGAIDNKVGFVPGTPAGSPWTLPNLGKPSAVAESVPITPKRTWRDIRGGARMVWNALGATFSAAHYYTYFDMPALEMVVQPTFPLFPPVATFPNGYSTRAIQTAPVVQVSGLTGSFAPDPFQGFYATIRSELAYFKDEPRFRQSQLDPFAFHGFSTQTPTTGGRALGDSINYVLGLDANYLIPFLNPHRTFFFSTQLFYKHLRHAVPRGSRPLPGTGVFEGEVLPVPQKNRIIAGNVQIGRLEPSFVRHPSDQFLHTLFVGTGYRSGTINPGLAVFYDWTGSLVYQPEVGFLHDPWRFNVSYSIIDAPTLKGASGTSLLRDRDNILFQLEYAL